MSGGASVASCGGHGYLITEDRQQSEKISYDRASSKVCRYRNGSLFSIAGACMEKVASWKVVAAAAGLLIPVVSSSQQPPSVPNPSHAKPAAQVVMSECEAGGTCAGWTFLGLRGNGQGTSGEVENLTIKHADKNSVTIARADSTGSTAGLTGTYIGTLRGGRIEGTFTSTWSGHWESKTGT